MIKHAYIHIPFCKRKCYYCSFVSGIDFFYKKQYIDALLKEIKIKYKNDKLNTLYFGGGTPSLLEVCDFENIISNFNLNSNCEITVEANPESVSFSKFRQLKNLGINRISLGVQTFNDKILKEIGRIHNQKDILKSIDIIKRADINNISIDLIYGLPSQTMSLFKTDLKKAVACEVNHISTYGLKIEQNSLFYNNKPLNLPDDDLQAEMYIFLCNFLQENKFIHYEISNFAKKSKMSKHNYAYWKNENYYGFGLNASGYEGNIRYKNISDVNDYIKNPLKTEEKYELCCYEMLEYEIMLALRLKEGININNLNNKYQIDFMKRYEQVIKKYANLKLMRLTNNRCRLTRQGILLSNEIMQDFIG